MMGCAIKWKDVLRQRLGVVVVCCVHAQCRKKKEMLAQHGRVTVGLTLTVAAQTVPTPEPLGMAAV
jgi:hypothetical protein